MYIDQKGSVIDDGSTFTMGTGEFSGEAGNILSSVRGDPGLRRPYFNEQGVPCVALRTNKRKYDERLSAMVPVIQEVPIHELSHRQFHANSQVLNATMLPRDLLLTIDRTVIPAGRERLQAWPDLLSAAPYGNFNGWVNPILEYRQVDDPGEAIMDMSGASEGRNDRQTWSARAIPLPIIHADFWFEERELDSAAAHGMRLDLSHAEAGTRRINETVERLTLGLSAFSIGSNTNYYGSNAISIYGYLNHPGRITKTDITLPTAGGWSPATLLAEVVEMKELARTNNIYGPFILYYSPDWDAYMPLDYNTNYGGVTTIDRLRMINGITDVKPLDALSTQTYTLVLVPMQSEFVQAIDGMGITVVQDPPTKGRVNMRIMCIRVPLVRARADGVVGIVHATTA